MNVRPTNPGDGIGCPTCWPVKAEAALEASRSLTSRHRLVDESHYGASIRACPACGQLFLTVFTERIDWEKGNDPQEFLVAAITSETADRLIALGDAVPEEALEAAPAGDWILQHRSPSSAPEVTRWIRFLSVGWHD